MQIYGFYSCPADNLPQTARSFLNTYFKGIDVISVIKESDGYDVRLVDGTEIDFRNNGEWKKVDCEGRAVPSDFYPRNINSYVITNYPLSYIEDIEFEHNRYKVGLNDPYDVDLIFDSNGNFIGVDD